MGKDSADTGGGSFDNIGGGSNADGFNFSGGGASDPNLGDAALSSGIGGGGAGIDPSTGSTFDPSTGSISDLVNTLTGGSGGGSDISNIYGGLGGSGSGTGVPLFGGGGTGNTLGGADLSSLAAAIMGGGNLGGGLGPSSQGFGALDGAGGGVGGFPLPGGGGGGVGGGGIDLSAFMGGGAGGGGTLGGGDLSSLVSAIQSGGNLGGGLVSPSSGAGDPFTGLATPGPDVIGSTPQAPATASELRLTDNKQPSAADTAPGGQLSGTDTSITDQIMKVLGLANPVSPAAAAEAPPSLGPTPVPTVSVTRGGPPGGDVVPPTTPEEQPALNLQGIDSTDPNFYPGNFLSGSPTPGANTLFDPQLTATGKAQAGTTPGLPDYARQFRDANEGVGGVSSGDQYQGLLGDRTPVENIASRFNPMGNPPGLTTADSPPGNNFAPGNLTTADVFTRAPIAGYPTDRFTGGDTAVAGGIPLPRADPRGTTDTTVAGDTPYSIGSQNVPNLSGIGDQITRPADPNNPFGAPPGNDFTGDLTNADIFTKAPVAGYPTDRFSGTPDTAVAGGTPPVAGSPADTGTDPFLTDAEYQKQLAESGLTDTPNQPTIAGIPLPRADPRGGGDTTVAGNAPTRTAPDIPGVTSFAPTDGTSSVPQTAAPDTPSFREDVPRGPYREAAPPPSPQQQGGLHGSISKLFGGGNLGNFVASAMLQLGVPAALIMTSRGGGGGGRFPLVGGRAAMSGAGRLGMPAPQFSRNLFPGTGLPSWLVPAAIGAKVGQSLDAQGRPTDQTQGGVGYPYERSPPRAPQTPAEPPVQGPPQVSYRPGRSGTGAPMPTRVETPPIQPARAAQAGAQGGAVGWIQAHGGHSEGVGAPELNPVFASKLAEAGQTYERETGGKAQFLEMGRSYDVQAKYRKEFEETGEGLAAKAGTSLHEKGLATDIPHGPFQDWMHRNAWRFGLRGLNDPRDRNHFQLAG